METLLTSTGATLISKVDPNKLQFNVKNKMAMICAKFGGNQVCISYATMRKEKWL